MKQASPVPFAEQRGQGVHSRAVAKGQAIHVGVALSRGGDVVPARPLKLT
eukprot:CAMPEP_0204300458 /NCGR_PEP_ID=MMETSP0468-20130131/78665_1 /ASSEMBLY_ACC=CAM_ASM_000383 /TAXON_ID=2969 /ORGANISM="Oxyrrhis marina" /LENGTH=49 /DNA_ID= /DNA_START= /DNA_END= /DNA_ORIENTATION=